MIKSCIQSVEILFNSLRIASPQPLYFMPIFPFFQVAELFKMILVHVIHGYQKYFQEKINNLTQKHDRHIPFRQSGVHDHRETKSTILCISPHLNGILKTKVFRQLSEEHLLLLLQMCILYNAARRSIQDTKAGVTVQNFHQNFFVRIPLTSSRCTE